MGLERGNIKEFLSLTKWKGYVFLCIFVIAQAIPHPYSCVPDSYCSSTFGYPAGIPLILSHNPSFYFTPLIWAKIISLGILSVLINALVVYLFVCFIFWIIKKISGKNIKENSKSESSPKKSKLKSVLR